MLVRLFAAVFTTALVAPPVANPCLEFDALYARIRDQTIDRASALARVRELLPQIRAFYYAYGGKDTPADAGRVPLHGYGSGINCGGKSEGVSAGRQGPVGREKRERASGAR